METRRLLTDPWITAGAIGVAGSLAPLAPFSAALVALVWVLGAQWNTRSITQFLAALTLFVFCGGRALHHIRLYQQEHAQISETLGSPQRCSGTGVVIASPTIRTNEEGEHISLWTAEMQNLDCESVHLARPTIVRLYGAADDLARGDQIEVIAGLAPTRLFRNASLPNPWPGAARRRSVLSGSVLHLERIKPGSSLSSLIDRGRALVRQRIVETYAPPVVSLGKALVLGENDLEEEDADAFKNSGLLHLLAVSGTHLVIAVLGLVEALRAILVRILPLSRRLDCSRLSSALGAVLSLLYADFSGGSGSAWRAAFMLCVVCGGRALGLRITGAAALGSSLLVGLWVDPLSAYDFSFLLSALATSGLILLGQPLGRLLDRKPLNLPGIRQLTLSLLATISSTLPCAPVLAMMDGNMTGAALFANVVAAPLGEIIALPACLLHAAVSWFPALEEGLAMLGSGALYAVRSIALWSASVESARFSLPLPQPWHVALGISLLLLFSCCVWRTRLALIALSPLLSVCTSPLQFSSTTPRTLRVTALDVGQGDALFLEFPDGKTALMDGGGFATGRPDTAQRVLLPHLRALGVKRLDMVALSHPHPDHMLGLISLSTEIDIGELWLPGGDTPYKAGLRTLSQNARARGAKIVRSEALCKRSAQSSHGFTWGGAQIQVLAPCQTHLPPLHVNDSSLVLRIQHGRRSVLLTGDIEERAEELLVNQFGSRLRADVLKVGHHGSHTSSTSAFLKAVSPSWAFISCGMRNRFNHPRPTTLSKLEQAGISVLRTDKIGSLTWSTDGQNTEVRAFSLFHRRSQSESPP